MNAKQKVRELLENLPDEATLAEIRDGVDLLESIEASEADVAAGRVIPHERVMRELDSKWFPKAPPEGK